MPQEAVDTNNIRRFKKEFKHFRDDTSLQKKPLGGIGGGVPWSMPGRCWGSGRVAGCDLAFMYFQSYLLLPLLCFHFQRCKFSFYYKLYSQLLHIQVNPKSQQTWSSNNILTQKATLLISVFPLGYGGLGEPIRAFLVFSAS